MACKLQPGQAGREPAETNRAISYLLVAGVTVFAFVFALEKIYNYDIWWHLRSGAWMLDNREVLRTDIFSFATSGASWVNTAWLGGIVLAAINRLSGPDGLVLFKATLIGLSFGSACLFLVHRGVNPYLAASVLGLAVVAARFRFLLRPQMFMFPFTLALYWQLTDAARSGRLPGRTVLALPLMTALWANLHGSVLLAPLFTLFLLIDRGVAALRQRPQTRRFPIPLRELLLLLLVSGATLATPFGQDTLRLVFRVIVLDNMLFSRSYSVEEFQPLAWGSHEEFWWLLGLTGASLLLNLKRARPLDLLLYLCMAALALKSVRFAGISAFVMAMLMARSTQEFFVFVISMPDSRLFRARGLSLLLLPALAVLAAWSFTTTFTPEKVYLWGLGIQESRYPVRSVSYLRDRGFRGNIFNSWQDGGYILYHLPAAATFIDGRCLPEQLALYEEVARMDARRFQRFLDSTRVDAALVRNGDAAAAFFELSPAFSLVFLDETHQVYLRSGVAGEGGLRFSFIRPAGYDLGYLAGLAKGENADLARGEFRRALARFPDNFMLNLQFAVFLDQLEDPASVGYYLRAARINPPLGFSHFRLGVRGGRAALRYRRWREGVELLESALDNGSGSAELHFLLGTARYQAGRLEQAEDALREALSRNKDNLQTLVNLGFLYVDMKRFREAEAMFAKALALEPASEPAAYGHALALSATNGSGAKEAWQKFLDRFPRSRRAEAARGFLQNIHTNN